MGFFGKLFGTPDYRESILRATASLADETERVYRNHLNGVSPSPDGLLKARLLSAGFGVGVYCSTEHAKNAQTDDEVMPFMYSCIEIAMRPLSLPADARQESIAAAGLFMARIVKLVEYELREGPSTVLATTDSFRQLVEVYHRSLAESFDPHRYETEMKSDYNIYAESVIWTHLRFYVDSVQQIRK